MSHTAQDRIDWFADRYEQLVGNVGSFIRGKDPVVRMAATCMLAEGHLLIEDVPGVGKTSLAKALASSFDGTQRRIQCTPDLLPADITGVSVWDQAKREFEFRPGPVFANIVVGDEINRASPKTQSALLEVMEECQVSVDGMPYAVPSPFTVFATQNPAGFDRGTYHLPPGQLDRFMIRVAMGYPEHEREIEVVQNRGEGQSPEQLAPVLSVDDVRQMIEIAREVYMAPALQGYVVTVVASTRRHADISLGASPRASVALARAAKAFAAANGNGHVSADDVKRLAPYVLEHRLIIRPEAALQGQSEHDLLAEILASVPIPMERAGV